MRRTDQGDTVTVALTVKPYFSCIGVSIQLNETRSVCKKLNVAVSVGGLNGVCVNLNVVYIKLIGRYLPAAP